MCGIFFISGEETEIFENARTDKIMKFVEERFLWAQRKKSI